MGLLFSKMPELKWTSSREWRERAEAVDIAVADKIVEDVKPNVIVMADGSMRACGTVRKNGSEQLQRMVGQSF